MRESFDSSFKKSQKEFDSTFRFMKWAFVITFLLTVGYWICIGFVAVKAVDALSSADSHEVAKELGGLIKSFNEGASGK